MASAELFQDSCLNSEGGGGNGINIFQSILPSLGLLKHFPESRTGRTIKTPGAIQIRSWPAAKTNHVLLILLEEKIL
jgi:hypothetical protein